MKSHKSKTFVMILSSIAAAFALGGAVLLFLAMTNDFDASIMHFEYGSSFAAAAFAICIMSVALAAGGFFMSTNRLSYDIGTRFSSVTVFISTLAGLTCLLYVFVGVRGELPETKQAVFILELVFAVLSAAFFLMKAAGVIEKKPSLSLTGLFPALMCAFALLRVYFNSDEPLNSPLKIYQIVMLVTFMLYFTAESGVSIGRPKMSRKFTFASLAAISIGGMVSLSRIAARISDVDSFDFNMVIETFRLIMWLYVVVTFSIKLLNSRENPNGYALLKSEDSGEEEKPEAASGEEDDELLDGIAAKLKEIEGRDPGSVPDASPDETTDTEDAIEEHENVKPSSEEIPEGAPEAEEEAEEPDIDVHEEEPEDETSDGEPERIEIPDDEPDIPEETDDGNPFTYNGGTADDEEKKNED